MKFIKTRLDVLLAVALVTFKEWGAYRSHSMVSIFVGPVFFVVQYFIWTAVFAAGGMPGMELEEVIRYFAATALIGYLVMDFADWNLSMLVQTGKFLTFSLRPMNHSFFALSQKVGHRILGFLVEFVPCWLIFTFVFGIDMRPACFGWVLVSVGLAFLMNFYVNYSIGLASFWIVQSGGIRSVYGLLGGIFSGALIPLVFFPQPLQIAQFFLPFQYTSFVPAMVFLGRFELGGMQMDIPVIVGIQAVAVIAVYVFCQTLNSLALKKFTAVGA
ncbi:MAG: ABC-2 family transporter protein [Defluviitaleaceae bacterium]|nr:ABC-2 family transporter protein [Defluviitaleaceae bacterium]